MVNILVPTDFSPLSKIAVHYSVKIANKLNGNVTLLHVIDLERQVKATLRMQTDVRNYVRRTRNALEAIEQEIATEVMIRKPVKFKISKGQNFSEAVLREARRLRSGLIVMGTRGATGIKRTIIGSNTASMIGISHIPVLAVPEGAEFKSFRNVVYATDLKNVEAELDVLIPYVQRFNSTIHVIHIVGKGGNVGEIEDRIDNIVKKTGYKNIVTLVTVDPDINGAIEQYIGVSKADLLAMFTHAPSFYEKLLDKSVTRNMAFHSPIPLLAFKQNGH